MTGKAVVERAVELWNDRDREGFLACFAEDCEFSMPRRRTGKGRDAVAAWWDINATAFGPGHVRPQVTIDSGETVVIESVYLATHGGPLPAIGSRREIPATGKSIEFPGLAIYTVRDGLVVSARYYWDALEMLDQLGQELPG